MVRLVSWVALAWALSGCAGPPAPADAPSAAPPPAANAYWVLVAAAFAIAIATGLCGLAQSRAVAAAAEGTARNPGAAAAIRFALLLGLVLIESLALYTLVICFIIIFKK